MSVTINQLHTGFRLVPTSMTLNAVNPVIAFILRFSLNSIDFQADYVIVVEDRPMMSVKYSLPVPSSTFGQNYNAPGSAVSLR